MNVYSINNHVLTCALSGRIDSLNSGQVENEIDENRKDDITSVVFDLQEVTYISSTFLRVVIKIAKALGKENLSIVNVQPSIMMVFKIANLTEVVKIG